MTEVPEREWRLLLAECAGAYAVAARRLQVAKNALREVRGAEDVQGQRRAVSAQARYWDGLVRYRRCIDRLQEAAEEPHRSAEERSLYCGVAAGHRATLSGLCRAGLALEKGGSA